jgi:hypothetical protein
MTVVSELCKLTAANVPAYSALLLYDCTSSTVNRSAVGITMTAKLQQQGEGSVSRATAKVQKAACVMSRLGKRGVWQAALQLKRYVTVAT